MLLALLIHLFSFLDIVYACAPTHPGGPGNCCPISVYNEASTGMAVFDPALRDCPGSAMLICSVQVVGNQNPTTIVINGATEVARGPAGTNTRVTMTCNRSNTTWMLSVNGVQTPVTSIACNNNP